MPALDALDVLLEVGDGAALDVGEDGVVGGVLAQQPLEVGVELADAGDEGGEVALDLGQLDVDAGGGVGGGRLGEQLGELGEAVADGVEHRGLQPDGVAQLVEGVQHPGDRRLAAAVSDHCRFLRSNSSGVA